MDRPQVTCRIALLLLPFLAGCGARIAPVHVKLVFDGKPVAGGSVLFVPDAPPEQVEAGRPASGVPDENGELWLTTSSKDDGALIGRHVVSYLAPGPPSTIDPELRERQARNFQKYGQFRLPPKYTVEVKPGRNEITLELIRGEKRVVSPD